jgi:hypothetical protein
MTVSLNLIIIVAIVFIISIGLNVFLANLAAGKKETLKFEEAFSILNTSIDIQKKKFILGLTALSKKYAVLSPSGKTTRPTESVQRYSEDKKKLKTAVVKKIVRSISTKTRRKLLNYYSEPGLIDYIITELDKFDTEEETNLPGGQSE